MGPGGPKADPRRIRCLRSFALDYYTALSAAAKRTGIPMSAALVLDCALLAEITPQQVAAMLNASPSSVTRQIDLLEEAGLIERRRVDGDRRRWHLSPTPQGVSWHVAAVGTVVDKYGPLRMPDAQPGSGDGRSGSAPADDA